MADCGSGFQQNCSHRLSGCSTSTATVLNKIPTPHGPVAPASLPSACPWLNLYFRWLVLAGCQDRVKALLLRPPEEKKKTSNFFFFFFFFKFIEGILLNDSHRLAGFFCFHFCLEL